MEDSEHAWHQHHLPAPWLQTSIGLGSGGQKGKWGSGEGQVAIGKGGGGEVFEGSNRETAREKKKKQDRCFSCAAMPCGSY